MVFLTKVWKYIRIGLRWLRTYWYIPFFLLLSVLGYIIFIKQDVTPLVQTIKELEVLKAGREVENLTIEIGAEKAKYYVEDKYKKELKQLTDKQRKQSEELLHDPVKRAKFLVRAAASNRFDV